MSYSRRFRHVKPQVVRATRDLAKLKPWTLEPVERTVAIHGWNEEVSRAYGMKPPTVLVVPGAAAHALGYYSRGDNSIVLDHFSLVTLLHEFRHAMQAQGVRFAGSLGDEEDARAWSLSLFRLAAPRRFLRMRRAGRIAFLEPVTPRLEVVSDSAVPDGTAVMVAPGPDGPSVAVATGLHEDGVQVHGHLPHPEASEAEETATRRAFGLPS